MTLPVLLRPLRLGLLALLVVALLPLAGCDSNGGGNSNNPNNAGTLTATINGSDSFSANLVQASSQGGVLAIGGIVNTGSGGAVQTQINLTVPNAGTGTFNVGIGGAVAIYFDGDGTDPNDAYASLNGTIVIDTFDSNGASGTFAFDGRNNAGAEVSVTDGEFDVTF
jgi:hypothetical protein